MRKWFIAAMLLISPAAHADETRFFCTTEEATNAIAEKIVVNQDAADAVAKPFINEGTCMYLPWDVHINVMYHGKVYSQSKLADNKLLVEVVGFMDGSNSHMFYGLMSVNVTSA